VGLLSPIYLSDWTSLEPMTGPSLTDWGLCLLVQLRRDKTSGLRNRRKHDTAADEPETILDIPELEVEGEEDITFQVAEAPRARNNRMQTMAELDSDQQFNLPSNTDNEVDLSLLTMVLCSSEQVVEDDAIWDTEILFTDVA